jgi:HSP20 family molecular chaperone IbpA
MDEQNLVRPQATQPPIVIKTTGLSVEAKHMFDSIARRAYEIFESKGRVTGHELDNWLQAEAELFERAPLNVGQSREGVTLVAEIRDFAPEELEIDLEPQRVTIIGKCHTAAVQKAGSSSSLERRTVRLLQSVQLPVEIDARHAKARCKGGVLELKLKKAIAGKREAANTASSGNGA